MKKLILALLIGAFAFSGCDNKAKDNHAYLIKMRLAKGDKFGYNTDMNMEMDMMNMKMKMEMGNEMEVVDSTAAGKELQITTTKMNVKTDMGGLSSKMDSTMNKSTSKAIGRIITITLQNNKVVAVKGLDNFVRDSSDTASQEVVRKMYTVENLNNMYGTMFSLYPNKPVKVGESWTAQNNMDVSGMTLTIDTRYTLTDVKDNIAEITVDGKIDTKGKMRQGVKEMEMNMNGTQKGKMNVKISDGYLTSGNYEINIDAKIKVMETEMPIKMKITCTMSGNQK